VVEALLLCLPAELIRPASGSAVAADTAAAPVAVSQHLFATAERHQTIVLVNWPAEHRASAVTCAASVAVSGLSICNIRGVLEHEVVCWHAETFRTAARAAAAAHAAVPSLSTQHQGNVIPAVVQANDE